MRSKKMKVARRIAEAHFSVEPNLKKVYVLEPVGNDDDDEPVKLLEVVEGSVAMGIYPVSFSADPANDIHYRSVIVEVAPKEWMTLKKKGAFSVRGREWKIGVEIRMRHVAA